MIQVTYTLEAPELIHLTRHKQLGWLRRLYWVAGIMFILLAAFGAISGKWEGLLMFGLPTALIVAIFEWRWPKLMDRMLRKSPSWGKPLVYTFEEARVTQKSAHSEAVMQWEAFRKVEELPDWFLLYIGPIVYVPLPKRAFQEGEMERFRNLLAQKMLVEMVKKEPL